MLDGTDPRDTDAAGAGRHGMIPASAPALSLVVPMLNERENLAPLVAETIAALEPVVGFEIVFVDDGSTDRGADELMCLMACDPRVRCLRHDRRYGQSTALRTGVRAARGALVAILDADRQNVPADLPALLAVWRAAPPGSALGMVAGERRERRDGPGKRLSSWLANAVRRWLLNDGVRDAGCSLKLLPRSVFLAMPQFDGMHRFLAALVQCQGLEVRLVEVSHRPRVAGVSKYGAWDRLWVGIGDMLAVWWLIRRRRRPHRVEELAASRDPDRELLPESTYPARVRSPGIRKGSEQ
jgi:dolichol-phosphate mannosyltransferase